MKLKEIKSFAQGQLICGEAEINTKLLLSIMLATEWALISLMKNKKQKTTHICIIPATPLITTHILPLSPHPTTS